MSKICRLILFTIFVTAPLAEVRAQESLPDAEPATTSEPEQRIVEGRPALYSFKRVINPFTWLEAGLRPVARSAESGFIHRLATRKSNPDKTSGIRFGFGGTGTGSGMGPVVTPFHRDFLGRGIEVEVPLVYTHRAYQSYQVQGRIPLGSENFVQRLRLELGAGYSSRAADDFFGIGNDSRSDDESSFRTVTREASAGFAAELNDDWKAGLRGVYRNVGVTNPTTGDSLQDQAGSVSVPGLFGATMGSAAFSIGRDTQVREDFAFKGSLDQLEVSFNDSVGKGDFRYWRYRLTSQHFIPLTNDNRKVIAFRALLETNRGRVPFFDMPFLGSQQTLRGFESFRFRDRTALALTLEYRYRIWPRIDAGLFVDEGQVAPELGDLGLDRFHTGYGARLFVWPKPNTPISIDYGRSRETWRLHVSFKPRF